MRSITSLFDQIAAEVEALSELRDKPRGTIRVTCTDDQIEMCLRPMLVGFLKAYPDITLESYVDYGFTNVVEERFDAGFRLGEAISKDMIAARIGPDWRLVVVRIRRISNEIRLLTKHACVNSRHRPFGALYAWEFEKNGKVFTVKVEGQLVFNSILHVLNAGVVGIGLAYVPEEFAAPYLADGRLKQVLSNWCPYFQGYHLYYPNTRQASPLFQRLSKHLNIGVLTIAQN